MTWDVPENALKMARAVGKRVARSHRQLIPEDELVSVGYEWIATHKKQVLTWAPDPAMKNLLYTTLLKHAQQYVLNERTRGGSAHSDQYFYNLPIIEALLPDVWDVAQWNTGSGDTDTNAMRGKSMPSEGGGRMAALADLSDALRVLSTDEERVLRLKYEAAMSLTDIAKECDVTAEAVRKRLQKAIIKMLDALGGEAPWELGKRVKRSNARAQAETRSTYEGNPAWGG